MPSAPSRSSTLTESTAEFYKNLDISGTIDLNSEATHGQIKEAIASDSVKNATLREIEGLNRTVRNIRRSFQKIRQDLQHFDKACYEGKDGVVLKLSPAWDKLYEVWRVNLVTTMAHIPMAMLVAIP